MGVYPIVLLIVPLAVLCLPLLAIGVIVGAIGAYKSQASFGPNELATLCLELACAGVALSIMDWFNAYSMGVS